MSVIETSLSHQTIGEIVREDIRAAKILKRNGIDFCCGGKKTLEKACEEKNVNIDRIQEELIILTNGRLILCATILRTFTILM